MGVLDAPLRAVASQLLNQFGKAGTLVLVTPGAYNPATSSTAAPTETNVSVRSIPEQYKARFAVAEKDSVKGSDLQRTIAALGIAREPGPTDRFVEDGVTYQVVHADPIYGGDLGVLYVLHLKR